jgi:hypothetical protein
MDISVEAYLYVRQDNITLNIIGFPPVYWISSERTDDEKVPLDFSASVQLSNGLLSCIAVCI